MQKVRITAVRRSFYADLSEKYENFLPDACNVTVGQTFVSENAEKPEGFCDSAWESMRFFVEELARGGGNFYDGWMKNPYSAMISCNDGFRPVSFLLVAEEE